MKRKRKLRTQVRITYVVSHPELDSGMEISVPTVQVDSSLASGDEARKAIISINGRDIEEIPSTAITATPQRAA